MVSRRRAAGVLVALVASLAACSSRESDQRLVTLDRTRTSPSGEAVAALVAEDDVLHPIICDREGEEMWRDDLEHVERYVPGVLWESGADVLWILSTDHGNASVRRDSSGAWARTMGSDGMPEDVAALVR